MIHFPGSAFGDLSGTTPSNIPEDTISTSLTWNWDMNGWNGYTRKSHLYSSEAILLENPVHKLSSNLKVMVLEKWIL